MSEGALDARSAARTPTSPPAQGQCWRPARQPPEPARSEAPPEPPQHLKGRAADTWRELASELHQLGLLSLVDYGSRQEAETMQRVGAEFGLSPISRLRLTGITPPQPPSKFDGLIG
jgi:phage terminase small subunit